MSKNYMPQMDGLRAAAVLAVLYFHWFDPKVPVGSWGVTLFFVISGYLITRSIAALRDEGLPTLQAARIFFTRRTLRLFPAYYLLLAIGALLLPDVRADLAWYATYTSNFLLEQRQRFIGLTPTWSLAVEEQFYLVWFFAILLVRRPVLLIAALLVLAPVARFLALAQGDYFSNYALWAQCDALAAGAALFLLERAGRRLPVHGAAALALLAALCATLAFVSDLNPWFGSIGQSGVVLVSAYAVWASRDGFPGLLGKALGNPWLVHVGKVSYGVYLYHMVTPTIESRLPLLWRLFDGPARFIPHCLLTIALASLSYRYFEAPIRFRTWGQPAPSRA